MIIDRDFLSSIWPVNDFAVSGAQLEKMYTALADREKKQKAPKPDKAPRDDLEDGEIDSDRDNRRDVRRDNRDRDRDYRRDDGFRRDDRRELAHGDAREGFEAIGDREHVVVERAGGDAECALLVVDGGERAFDVLDVREGGLDVAACELRYPEGGSRSNGVCRVYEHRVGEPTSVDIDTPSTGGCSWG